MFDKEKFYKEATQGKQVNNVEVKEYLHSFRHLVIWGAGNLGREIALSLGKEGISIDAFWDIRYTQLVTVDGIPVEKPYSETYDRDTTLIIFCIANVASSPALMRELKEHGWKNELKGVLLYQGLLCPLSIDKPFRSEVCVSNKLCTLCNCDKLNNILLHKQAEKKNIEIKYLYKVNRVHFIINNFCNLRCTYCMRYMNSYPPEKRRNLDVDVVRYDIKRVMEAIDSVGVVIVFGGEPFLHPDLDEIMEEILNHDNYGGILVNSNGVGDIKEAQISHMRDKRIRVAFSNYTSMLEDKKKNKYKENIAFLEEQGVCIQAQNTEPPWTKVTTLENKKSSVDECISKRKECAFPYLYIFDHKVFPCSMGLALYDLGVADYPEDYVDITKYDDNKELGKAIIDLNTRMYLKTCSHCAARDEIIIKAAEQGFSERYALPKKL